MGEGQDTGFIKLTQKQVQPRIDQLVKSKANVKIWKKGQKHIVCVLDSYDNFDGIRLSVQSHAIDETWLNKNILINFNYNKLDYFSKGLVESTHSNDKSSMTIKLGPHIFRAEKREKERLLVFPHHQAYAYFRVDHIQDKTNVLAFNKHREKNTKAFEKFDEMAKAKIFPDRENINELMGFRVLDVSEDGLSFLVNKKEGYFFEDENEKGRFDFTLLIDGDVFELKQATVVYNIHYVSSSASFGPMYKIAVQFEEQEALRNYLDKLLNDSTETSISQKEFEDFVDDE